MDECGRARAELFRDVHFLCGALFEFAPFGFIHSREYADAHAALINLEMSVLGGAAYGEAEGGFHAAQNAGRMAAKAFKMEARGFDTEVSQWNSKSA